jgi:hypothetical protein
MELDLYQAVFLAFHWFALTTLKGCSIAALL